MNNEIQVAKSNLPETATPQTVFTNSGENGVQIANQSGAIVNVYLPGANGTVYNAATLISTEYYNLFVIGDEPFNDPFFLIGKDRALTTSEGIAADISAQFAALTPEAIAAIKTFPSLFASENHQYGCTDADHFAFYGMVTDVRIQENGIKIYYQKFSSVPQQKLNEIAFNLAIKGTSSFNELNRTHWAIKRIHLIEELRTVGISVLVPT
ncbi:hypothetical protein FACS1894132_05740 [Clostridia bacterium]|nr:hypothetical protein FACS1894132_05740 [Clostridia bacterium]